MVVPFAAIVTTELDCTNSVSSVGSTKIGSSAPLTSRALPTVQGNRGFPYGPGASALKPLPIVMVGGVEPWAGLLPSVTYVVAQALEKAHVELKGVANDGCRRINAPGFGIARDERSPVIHAVFDTDEDSVECVLDDIVLDDRAQVGKDRPARG